MDSNFLKDFLNPQIEQLSNETDQWLKDNGYCPILTVDIKKMLLQHDKKTQQDQLKFQELSCSQELENSKARRRELKLKIDEYKKEQERMKKLNKLLEEDMLDLNNLE